MHQVPAHWLPVSDTVRPEEQALIGARLSPTWNVHPKSAEEWKELVAKLAAPAIARAPDLLAKLNVKREKGEKVGSELAPFRFDNFPWVLT
jgi:hypothetical protein